MTRHWFLCFRCRHRIHAAPLRRLLLDRTMTAREDYPLLATAERYEEFGEARRALDEIDRLRAEMLKLAWYRERFAR